MEGQPNLSILVRKGNGMKNFEHLLLGGDLRSVARILEAIRAVQDQQSFDIFFKLIFHHERQLVMRAADAVEKITRMFPWFLAPHKGQLLDLLNSAINIELKWHVAQLITRVPLTYKDLKNVWSILAHQAQNPNESKIVRVNSIEAMYTLSQQFPELKNKFMTALHSVEH